MTKIKLSYSTKAMAKDAEANRKPNMVGMALLPESGTQQAISVCLRINSATCHAILIFKQNRI
jgi:hypothetical protein